MVETLALRIAEAIKRTEPDRTASVAVMKFSLEAIINSFITMFLIALIGFISGKFGESVLGLGAFAVLRFFSGGFHLRTAMHCSLVSTILISLAPHIPLTDPWILACGGVSLTLLLLFAPANIEGHARIPKKYFPVLKMISGFIVLANLLFLNSTLAIVFLIQSLTTISYKRR